MFCSNCGTQLQDGEKFCPNCGTPVAGEQEIKGFTVPEENGPATDGSNNWNGYNVPPIGGAPLRTDRNFWLYLLLTWCTCGIYGLIFQYQLIKDVNVACHEDGDETPGLLMLILLSIVTCGIYSFIWHYKIGNRLYKNCKRYGYNSTGDGLTVLLWMLLSTWVCGIGTYVAHYIIINMVNEVCAGYNRANGLA